MRVRPGLVYTNEIANISSRSIQNGKLYKEYYMYDLTSVLFNNFHIHFPHLLWVIWIAGFQEITLSKDSGFCSLWWIVQLQHWGARLHHMYQKYGCWPSIWKTITHDSKYIQTFAEGKQVTQLWIRALYRLIQMIRYASSILSFDTWCVSSIHIHSKFGIFPNN